MRGSNAVRRFRGPTALAARPSAWPLAELVGTFNRGVGGAAAPHGHASRSHSIITAYLTTSLRSRRPSLRIAFDLCTSTVFMLIVSRDAISLLLMPSALKRRT